MMNQTSGDKSDKEVDVLSTAEIILTMFDILLIIIVAVGNSLTVAVVCRFKRFKCSYSIMIASLAVADLIMGIVYTPTKIMYTTQPSIFESRGPCIVYIFITHFSAFCAVMAISMLSIERGYAVQFPFHYHSSMTTKCAVLCCLFAFAFIFCLTLPLVSGLDEHYGENNCFAPKLYPKAYLRTLIAVAVTILLIGFIAFLRVLVAELRLKQNSVILTGQQSKKSSSVRCRLMCVVYVSSLVFWLPHLTYYFYITFTKQERNLVIFRILSIFDLCSSAVNFFIYGFKNSNFRMAYRQLLGLGKRTSVVTTISEISTIQRDGL